MTNMRIGGRILLGFGAVVTLTIVMGLYALSQESAVRHFANQMDDRDLSALDTLRRIEKNEASMRALRQSALLGAFLRKEKFQEENAAAREREWEDGKERNLRILGELAASAAEWQKNALTPTRASQWRKVSAASREAQDALKELAPEVEAQFAALNQGDLSGAIRRMASIDRSRMAYEAKLADAQRAVQDQIGVGRAAIADFYDRTRASVIFALILAVLLSLLFSILIQRSITRPLRQFMVFVERVGTGDLTEEAKLPGRDELGDLAQSLNRMVTGLKEVAAQTRGVAEHLNAATAEILASTQQQAANTAEQAAAVQQANAAMAEISQSGAQISERARQVAAAAEATSSSSAAGLQSVQNTAAMMENIRQQAEAVAENVIALSDKTQAIREIIASVTDISEQSHLLALNASIQAAAAGEYGKSFSVVASEMKNLAAQSKQATVQVRSILGDIQKAITSSVMLTEEAVKRVESGRQQADVADRSIRSLTGNIEESVRAFQQIVAGSSQQQIGFEQVTQAFRSIGVASQQTAASTKQSEKAAANLNALAQQLRGAVERYKL